MPRHYAAILCFAAAILIFIGWFVVASGLRRDSSPDGTAADVVRRQRLRRLMLFGFSFLLVGIAVTVLR